MKMPSDVFERHYADMRKVMQEIVDTGLKPVPSAGDIDVANLSMRDMWDIQLKVFMDRGNEYHPMYEAEGVMPRVLEYTDQSPHFLYNDYDLDDSHIETAFRAMIKRIEAEPLAPARSMGM